MYELLKCESVVNGNDFARVRAEQVGPNKPLWRIVYIGYYGPMAAELQITPLRRTNLLPPYNFGMDRINYLSRKSAGSLSSSDHGVCWYSARTWFFFAIVYNRIIVTRF